MRRAVGGCGTQAQTCEVNVFMRRSGRAPDLGSRSNVELEGKEETENPTFPTSATEEKGVMFEITAAKAIWGEAF